MKKITRFLLAVLLVVVLVPARITKVSAAGIPINAVNFPDIVFMQYVQWGLFGGKSEITADEAASIKTIELGAASGGEGLQSLEGICYFPNLETIIISDAQVKELDLSDNHNVKYVYCDGNGMTKLTIGDNNLVELNCARNSISSLSLTSCTNLETLSCEENNLSSLSLTKNTKLKNLYAMENKLKKLDLSKNTKIVNVGVSKNQIATINAAGCTYLETLQAANNPLTSLDVTSSAKLRYLDLMNTSLTSLDLTKNTKLENLYLAESKIDSINLSKNTALKYLFTSCSKEDITALRNLVWYTNTNKNLKSVDLLNCESLKNVELYSTVMKGLDIRWCWDLVNAYDYGTETSDGTYITYSYTDGSSLSVWKGTAVFAGLVSRPVLSTVKNEETDVYLNWKKSKEAMGYQVYRKTAEETSYHRVGSTTSLLYRDSTAEPGVEYDYKVRGYFKALDGEYFYSTFSSVKKLVFLPMIQSVTLKNVTNGIKIEWDAAAAGDYYQLYRKEGNGSFTKIKTFSSKVTSYTDEDVTSGKDYQYKIRVYKKDSVGTAHFSQFSDYVQMRYLKRVSLTSVTPGSSGVALKWGSVAGASGYQVYRKASNETSYHGIKKTTSTSWTDTTAVSGVTYSYKVRAYYNVNSQAVNYGSFSAIKTVKAK